MGTEGGQQTHLSNIKISSFIEYQDIFIYQISIRDTTFFWIFSFREGLLYQNSQNPGIAKGGGGGGGGF